MAKLYDEARKLVGSDESLAALRSQPGIPDEGALRSAVDYALPVVVSALDRRVAESHGTVELVELFRSLDYSELRTPFMWNSTSTRAVTGGNYLRAAFAAGGSNSDHRFACRQLAQWTSVSPPAAERILKDVAWVYCALLAQSQADRLDLQTMRNALVDDRRAASRAGYDDWISTALPQPMAAGDYWQPGDTQPELAPLEQPLADHNETNDTTFNPAADVDGDIRPRRAVAMASTSGPGRYPPPVRRDQRAPNYPSRSGSVPPPRRPGQNDQSRPVPAPRGRERDAFDGGGGYYDRGQPGPRSPMGGDPFDDPRQPPTRHRPISQSLGDNRQAPPFEPPSTSRRPFTLILGTLALLLVGAALFWLYTNVLPGIDADGVEVTAGDEAATATDETAELAADETAEDSQDAADADAPAETETATDTAVEPGPENRIELTVPMVDIFTNNAAASGSIGMTMDRVTGEICFGVETTGIEPPYPAHIHRGELGVKGPVAVDFTPQSDVGLKCINVPPKNVQEILANPEGYYAEMHDATNKTLTIRGQISEATVTSDPGNIFGAAPLVSNEGPPTDPTGGGASIVIENGAVFLRGEVADDVTAQQVRDQVSGLGADIPLQDELTVSAGAPLPSGIIEVSDGIEFDSGSADLAPTADAVLDVVAGLIAAHPEWTLFITGHTDDVGGDVPNLDLSLRRANSVRDALLTRGVAEEQLGVLGAGARLPKVPNDSDENRAINRRIEFEIDAS